MRSSEPEHEDTPELSEYARQALEEFLRERSERQNPAVIEENWQLSQFWYSDGTALALAKEASRAAEGGKIVCISCPTLYRKLKELECHNEVALLEFDKRFECYGDEFIFYDYNDPLGFEERWKGTCDVVVLDPPFLSEECLAKVSQTVKFLNPKFIILCTGAVMEPYAQSLLGLRPCKFKPTHTRKLGNEFKCFANYNMDEFCS
uniref:Protein-lysine N-methyltransferase DAMT1 n=1 Tax=Ixodes ricinus TaxID=34613 RepID=A0A4D6FZ91_IXORI|nr:DNA N6-adenine methyltransferase [Ixodes ricinus]